MCEKSTVLKIHLWCTRHHVNLAIRSASAWTAICLCSLSLTTLAKVGIQRLVESATSRDGSALKVVTMTNDQLETRRVQIHYRAGSSGRMPLIWKKYFSISGTPSAGITVLQDWSLDGVNEVSVVSECGDGPNCETIWFTLDKTSQQLVATFTTNGAWTKTISGYLTDMSRNNRCSWMGSAYRVLSNWVNIEPVADFYIYISADDVVPAGVFAKCFFYKKNPTGENVIPPPSKALQQMRHWYDDKRS